MFNELFRPKRNVDLQFSDVQREMVLCLAKCED